MNDSYINESFILKTVPYRERDTLVTMFMRESGRVDLIARGTGSSSSKLAGHIQPLTRSRTLVVKGKGFDYIASADNLTQYSFLKSDLAALKMAGEAVRIVLKMVKSDEPDERIFSLLEEYLFCLDSETSLGNILNDLLPFSFVLKLFSLLGYRPQLNSCIVCNGDLAARDVIFSASDGGFACTVCSKVGKDLKIKEDLPYMLRFISTALFLEIARKEPYDGIKDIEKLVKKFIDYQDT